MVSHHFKAFFSLLGYTYGSWDLRYLRYPPQTWLNPGVDSHQKCQYISYVCWLLEIMSYFGGWTPISWWWKFETNRISMKHPDSVCIRPGSTYASSFLRSETHRFILRIHELGAYGFGKEAHINMLATLSASFTSSCLDTIFDWWLTWKWTTRLCMILLSCQKHQALPRLNFRTMSAPWPHAVIPKVSKPQLP